MTNDEAERRERMAQQGVVFHLIENPEEARRDTLRHAALLGLQHELHQITNNNHFDREEIIRDLKRAINYLRGEA